VTAIDRPYVDEVCRIGQGAGCCAYLLMGADGFECAKDLPGGVEVIIAKLEDPMWGSRGDNCEGWSTRGAD
jgi:hypothetical protein